MASAPAGSKVYLVIWRDAANAEFLVVAAYADLAAANIHVRRLGNEELSDGLTSLGDPDPKLRGLDAEPLRWDTADGLSCWVEQHVVKGADEAVQEGKEESKAESK